MQFTRRQLFKAAGAVAVAGAIGSQISHRVSAHVDIDEEYVIHMNEMFFQKEGQDKGAAIRVPANKVVRLVFKNDGTVLHDVHLGKDADLAGRKYNTDLAAPFDMMELPAGGEAWLTFTFGDAQKGEWELGCFQLGHYEGGMKAPFIIE